MNGSGQYGLSAVRSFDWTNLSLTKFSQLSDSGTVEWRIGKGFGDWYERKNLVRKAIWIKAVELMGIQFYFFSKFCTKVSNLFGQQSEFFGGRRFWEYCYGSRCGSVGSVGSAPCIEEFFSSPYMGCWGLEGGCSLFNFREISKFVVNRHVWEG